MLHLKLLGKCLDSKYLSDISHIKKSIENCINLVKMRPIIETQILDVPIQLEKLNLQPFEDEGGITCQVIGYGTLSTSHIAIHTWPIRNEFHLDLYSCREFDGNLIINFLKNWFKILEYKFTDCSKGCLWEK